MPRAKLETAFIGRYTLAALDAAPDAAFLWLGRALFAWILRDELPQEVPPEHVAAWTMIREESANIHDARKQFADAGRKGGEANASERKRKEANASEGKRTETKKEKEMKKEMEKEPILRTESERAGKPASASASASVFTDLDSLDWFTIPERALVDRALALIGEEGNARMAGRLRKARRILGLPALRELLATFDSELRAGEVPANKGATLNARLSAREAMS